jgi:hypothetical protein
MAARSEPASDEPRALQHYRDWVWIPIAEPGTHGGDRGTAADEFWHFPPLVRGELLARIQRLLAGETRRGDVTSLGHFLQGMALALAKTHYWIIYTVVNEQCLGLLCCTTDQRILEDRHRAKAIARAQESIA